MEPPESKLANLYQNHTKEHKEIAKHNQTISR